MPTATKLGQGNIFTSVCLSTGGGGVSASVHAGIPPLWSRHPPGADTHSPSEQTPPGRRDPPWTRHPPSRHPPDQATPPGPGTPREADCSIRLTSGRYASYWNAFLFKYTAEGTGQYLKSGSQCVHVDFCCFFRKRK